MSHQEPERSLEKCLLMVGESHTAKDSQGSAFHSLSYHPPSRCGSCPFTLHSGLISKISFCLVCFGHFVNHPPDPAIHFINLSLAGTQQ